jgi:uncharacterized protein YkwD
LAFLAAGLLPQSAAAFDREATVAKMVDRVNAERRQHGLNDVAASPKLMGSAQRVSRKIIVSDVFAHSNLVFARGSRVLGETLESHSGSRPRPAMALRILMRSSTHRGLILGRKMRTIGAGVVRGRLFGQRSVVWILHLGR